MTDLQTGVMDKVLVIDPGSDIGADICVEIAVRVEGRLAALGTQVLLTRSAGNEVMRDEASRADFANRIGADLLVSIHCDEVASPHPNGVVTFYYGEPFGGIHSYSGRRLAELIQDEVCGRTSMIDCRSLPRTWDLLRMTRMPAVRIDVGYLSNGADADRLATTQYQDAVADGIASAIRAFCAPN